MGQGQYTEWLCEGKHNYTHHWKWSNVKISVYCWCLVLKSNWGKRLFDLGLCIFCFGPWPYFIGIKYSAVLLTCRILLWAYQFDGENYDKSWWVLTLYNNGIQEGSSDNSQKVASTLKWFTWALFLVELFFYETCCPSQGANKPVNI